MSDVQKIARDVEQAPKNQNGELNLTNVYNELCSLSKKDGGQYTEKFQGDLQTLNGILPNLQIEGFDPNNDNLITKSKQGDAVSVQNASSVAIPSYEPDSFREFLLSRRGKDTGMKLDGNPNGPEIYAPVTPMITD